MTVVVTVLKDDGMNSTLLPDKAEGQYWIPDYSETGAEIPLVSMEGIYERWILKSNKRVQVYDGNGRKVESIFVNANELYCLLIKEQHTYAYLYIEPDTVDRKQYKKYYVWGNRDVCIGRSKFNHICVDNIVVSSKHARLERIGDSWIVTDENSANGVYVNNRRVPNQGSCALKPGDVIFIMGFKIIVGRGFFAVNNPDQKVSLDKQLFFPYTKRDLVERAADDYEDFEMEYFYRSPGFKNDIEVVEADYLESKDCVDTITAVKNSLWERRLGQKDFLNLRVGKGNASVDVQYNYQAPITVSFLENYISGVVGNRADTLPFAKGLILQMVTYFGYDDLKLILLIDSQELKEFEILRFIPHFWDNDKKIRFIATDALELKVISSYLEQEMEVRSAMNTDECRESVPYYMILVFDRELAAKAEILKLVYHQDSNLQMSAISFFDEVDSLPKECTSIVEIEGSVGKIFNKRGVAGEGITFIPDIGIQDDMDLWSMQLSNLSLDMGQKAYEPSKMTSFPEMYQVGGIEYTEKLFEDDSVEMLDTTGNVIKRVEMF